MWRALVTAFLLLLPCPGLVGCSHSSSSASNPEAQAEPLSDADLADAQAAMDGATNAERAYQSEYPVGKKAGRNR